jgi:hypothetical protein
MPLDSIVLIDLFGVDPISLRSLIFLDFSFGLSKEEKVLASQVGGFLYIQPVWILELGLSFFGHFT